MVVVGIDPGCSGALVALSAEGEVLAHLQMPVAKQGQKNRVNGAAVAAWLRGLGGVRHAFLEQVGAMPAQGVSSVWTFGHAVGVVEGILQGLEIPYTLVTPVAWKKGAGLIGTDKDAARSRAIQLYPALRALDTKARGQALADAILIARHGSQLLR